MRPGDILDARYEIVRPIGRGGMGAVYEAIQRDLGRRVAVKVLETGAEVVRLAQEARALAALNHPNVVTILDSRPDASPPFIAMDLVPGRSLEDLIADGGRLEPRRAAVIAAQLLSALGAAHRAGIIHRDVKPSNVLVVEGGPLGDLVKVVDFGIAKLTIDPMKQTTRGVLIGSLAYMAPEQILGRPIDARVDVFATGVTLYKMLSGNPAWGGDSAPVVALAICQEEPPPLVAPGPLVAIVARAMAKDPIARFASADEMRAALESYLAATTGAGPSAPHQLAAGPSAFASTVGPQQIVSAAPPPMATAPPPRTAVMAPVPTTAHPRRAAAGQEIKIIAMIVGGAAFLVLLGGIASVVLARQKLSTAVTYDGGTMAIDIPRDGGATQAEEDAIRRNLPAFARCFQTSKLRSPAYLEMTHGEDATLVNPEKVTIGFQDIACARGVDDQISVVQRGRKYRVRF